jgi:hypothetical protein
MTQMAFGFSGFHLLNIVGEAFISPTQLMVSQLAGAIEKVTHGDVISAFKLLGGAAKTVAGAPIRPITGIFKGRKYERLYLNLAPGSKRDSRLMDIYEKSGLVSGRKASPDYTFTAAGTFFDAFKRGGLSGTIKDIKGDFAGKTHMGKIAALGKQVGKTMQTVAQPLFDVYIPKMKMAAWTDEMKAWMQANPLATDADLMTMGAKIGKTVDDRFGEMNQDTQFWGAGMKQGFNLGAMAFTWTFGAMRHVGGGMLKGMTNPRSISLVGKDYDPRTGYLIALPLGYFIMGNVYTYLKTGKPPKDLDDALDNMWAPKTGGMVPGFGGRGEVPQRAQLPGLGKDVLGWYNDWRSEGYNKMGPAFKAINEMILTGKDYTGRDIRLHDWSDAPGWMQDYFRYMQQYQPISVQALERGQKRGSAIGWGESLMGIKEAPMSQEDPEGLARFQKHRQQQQLKARRKSDIRQQGQRTPNPPSGPME